MKTIFFKIVFSLLLCAVAIPAIADEYEHSVESKGLKFSWKIDAANINVKLHAATKGWIAIGFHPVRAMLGANFILGSVDQGTVTVSDEFGVRETAHEPDTKIGGTDNVTNIAGEETDGETEIRFTIPLDSGDDKDGVIKTDEFIPIALAYSAGSDRFRTKHFYRTTILINLGTGESKNP